MKRPPRRPSSRTSPSPSPSPSTNSPRTPDLVPDKPFFKIGEVARLVGVEPHVLRYWEKEFGRDIRPERTRSNQRVYRRRDVETFFAIKRLRYEEKLEVGGARRRLRVEAGESLGSAGRELAEVLRGELEDLLRVIDEDEERE